MPSHRLIPTTEITPHPTLRFEMESRNLNDFTIPLSSDKAFIMMNSKMILLLRKNAEVQAEFIKVQKQINELMHTRAKLEEMKLLEEQKAQGRAGK